LKKNHHLRGSTYLTLAVLEPATREMGRHLPEHQRCVIAQVDAANEFSITKAMLGS
jgi:hypothetical protein